ncbi:TPA: hypothetical protein ACNOHS_003942 [Citrobacter freundii]|nr:hypothetical protein [Citrobacter werkmanii]
MNQIRPFISLVQNGTMSLDEFKRKIQGYRAATKQDFDNYLLHALERDVAEVKRLPELGRWHRNMNPDHPLTASDTIEAAQGYSEAHFQRMMNGSDQLANEVLASLQMMKLELSKDDLPLANQVGAAIDMSRATVAQAYEAFFSNDLLRYRQLIATLQAQLEEQKLKSSPQSISLYQRNLKTQQARKSNYPKHGLGMLKKKVKNGVQALLTRTSVSLMY